MFRRAGTASSSSTATASGRRCPRTRRRRPRAALLDRGYALAGSSYIATGSWWALNTAVSDQFSTIEGVTAAALPDEPDRVLAFGTSMGGLVSALEAEQGGGIIDGALSTCGLVAGAIHLNNYQLDAMYVIAGLLMPAPGPKLVDFANPGEGAASGAALTAAVQAAQTTPEGRARLAFVFALLNIAPVAPGLPTPAPNDAAAVEAAQFASAVQSFPVLNFVQFGRYWIELAAGGNGSWTRAEASRNCSTTRRTTTSSETCIASPASI